MANYLYEKWLERYETLPEEIKKELDKSDEVIFQLKRMKGTRKYPEIVLFRTLNDASFFTLNCAVSV